MKKIGVFLGIFLMVNTLFSYDISDYILLDKALKESENKNYEKSKFYFDAYERNYKDTYPLTSNFMRYYMGLNDIGLKNYDEAMKNLNRAIYVPRNFKKMQTNKYNYFQYEIDYYRGILSIYMGEAEKGINYLTRLVTDYYDKELEPFEINALEILQEYDLKYKYIEEIKYENKMDNLNKLDSLSLKMLGRYFYSREKYRKSTRVYEVLQEKEKITGVDRNIYIKALIEDEDYSRAIQLTEKTQVPEELYLRGVAFERGGDYPRALFNYEKVTGEFEDRANLDIAQIYFKLGDIRKTKQYLRKVKTSSEDRESLYLEIYILEKEKEKFITTYEKYREKYQNYKEGIYYIIYSNLLKGEKNPWDIAKLNGFMTGSYVTRAYVNSLDTYNLKENDVEETLKEIAKLGNKEILDVAIANPNFFLDYDDISDLKAILESYKAGQFYKEALLFAEENRELIQKYSNTLHYLYPKYYQKEVEELQKKYSLPESLVYTIIYLESGFDSNRVSRNRVGLMGVEIEDEENKEEIKKYLDPKYNLQVGMENLNILYLKNNKNVIKTLLEYRYGKKRVNRLIFDIDGDINIDTISNEKLKEDIEKTIYAFAFYSKLYN